MLLENMSVDELKEVSVDKLKEVVSNTPPPILSNQEIEQDLETELSGDELDNTPTSSSKVYSGSGSADTSAICVYKNPLTSELCCAKIQNKGKKLLTHANRLAMDVNDKMHVLVASSRWAAINVDLDDKDMNRILRENAWKAIYEVCKSRGHKWTAENDWKWLSGTKWPAWKHQLNKKLLRYKKAGSEIRFNEFDHLIQDIITGKDFSDILQLPSKNQSRKKSPPPQPTGPPQLTVKMLLENMSVDELKEVSVDKLKEVVSNTPPPTKQQEIIKKRVRLPAMVCPVCNLRVGRNNGVQMDLRDPRLKLFLRADTDTSVNRRVYVCSTHFNPQDLSRHVITKITIDARKDAPICCNLPNDLQHAPPGLEAIPNILRSDIMSRDDAQGSVESAPKKRLCRVSDAPPQLTKMDETEEEDEPAIKRTAPLAINSQEFGTSIKEELLDDELDEMPTSRQNFSLCPALNRQVDRLNKGESEPNDTSVICFYENPITSELCCAKIPSNQKTLLTHANSHLKYGTWACRMCGQCFHTFDKDEAVDHMRTKHEDLPIKDAYKHLSDSEIESTKNILSRINECFPPHTVAAIFPELYTNGESSGVDMAGPADFQESAPMLHPFLNISFQTPIMDMLSEDLNNGKSRRSSKSYTIEQKLEVVEYAKKHSVYAASKHFQIDRKCVRDWRNNENQLAEYLSSCKDSTPQPKKRLPGGGRRLTYKTVDKRLANWVRDRMAKGLPVSCRIIQEEAETMLVGVAEEDQNFKASRGWLERFMARHNFRLPSARQVYISNVSTPVNYSPSTDVESSIYAKPSVKTSPNNPTLFDKLQAATQGNSFAHEKISLPTFKQNGLAGEKPFVANKAFCSSE
ncbi:tc5 transposase DNA-binding domain-containing protein [Ditylenchus destructor]|uniref:Tc5 transposase DNA-binding domain-containing protein n=1 Tax=Ditylenchus destructor TaxID=166010 RepID=A0AAD4MRR9_9BILA|nr:tc5 transposase DNA-binding domain-containing protein [Ditylenchus destructor]